jgi:hypothetical protein
VALYGSTTVSDTFGEGKTENVSIMRSGYSSLIFEINSVPIPDPVPPPREWHTWNPEHKQMVLMFVVTWERCLGNRKTNANQDTGHRQVIV